MLPTSRTSHRGVEGKLKCDGTEEIYRLFSPWGSGVIVLLYMH